MPLLFRLDVLGETQIEREFLRWGERALQARPLWDVVRSDLTKIELVQFLTEGKHAGDAWPELAESTLAAKKRKKQPPWIERATEDLFKSLTEVDGPGQIFEAFDDWMRFSTDMPYAGFQQTGTVNMPQRRLVHLTEPERRELARAVQRFIVHGEALSIYA